MFVNNLAMPLLTTPQRKALRLFYAGDKLTIVSHRNSADTTNTCHILTRSTAAADYRRTQ